MVQVVDCEDVDLFWLPAPEEHRLCSAGAKCWVNCIGYDPKDVIRLPRRTGWKWRRRSRGGCGSAAEWRKKGDCEVGIRSSVAIVLLENPDLSCFRLYNIASPYLRIIISCREKSHL